MYDINNIDKPIKTFNWPYEGWGLTHDSSSLIISDGSSNIYFVDAETFKVKNTISVKDDQGPVMLLNELEYIDGVIYANVYQSNFIVKIDAESGHVLGKITLTDFSPTDVNNDFKDIMIHFRPKINIIESKLNKMLVLDETDPTSISIKTVKTS